MTKRSGLGVALALVALAVTAGCPQTGGSLVTIKLVNASQTEFVSPNPGVCPNGITEEPHHFLTPNPVLGPGEQLTITSADIGGTDGDCQTFATAFMVGLCGWQAGPSADELTAVDRRFGGQIGVQFHCGDTIILRWSEAGDEGGTWTSEVQPALGNPVPSTSFQEL